MIQCLFVFACNRTKSRTILFTVNDLVRSVIEHSTDELDNRVRQPNDYLISSSKVQFGII